MNEHPGNTPPSSGWCDPGSCEKTDDARQAEKEEMTQDTHEQLYKNLGSQTSISEKQMTAEDEVGFTVPSLSEPGGDLSALEEMWPPVTVEHYPTDKTLPLDSQMTAHEMFSEEVVQDKLPRKSVSTLHRLKSKRRLRASRRPPKIAPEHGSPSSPNLPYSFNPSTSSQSNIPSVTGLLYPGNIPVQQGPNYGTGESLKKHAYGFPVQSLSEPGGDLSALEEMRPPVTVEHYPTDKTLPLDSQMTADEKFSEEVVWDKLPRKSVPRRFSNSSSTSPSSPNLKLKRRRPMSVSRCPSKIVPEPGRHSSLYHHYSFNPSTSSQSIIPSVAGPLYPGNIPVQQGPNYGTGESLKKHAYGFPVQSLSEPGGDLSALDEMWPPVTVEHYPTDKTLPLDSQMTADEKFSRRVYFDAPSESVFLIHRPTYKRKLRTSRNSPEIVSVHGSPSSPNSSYLWGNSPSSQSNIPSVAGPLYPGNIPVQQDSTYGTGESLKRDAYGFPVQSLSEPGGDLSALEEMWPPVTVEHYPTDKTLPLDSQMTADEMFSEEVVRDKLPRKTVSTLHRLKSKCRVRASRCPPKIVPEPGRHSSLYHHYSFNPSTSSQSIIPSVAGPLYPGNIPVQQGPNYGTGESLKKHAYGFPVQSLSEPGGDLSALEEMRPPVTVEHYPTDKTLPLDSQMTADEKFSEEVVWDKLPRKSVPRRFSNSSSTSPSSPNLKLKRRRPMSVSRCPPKIVPEPGRHSSFYHHYSFNPSTSSQSIIPSVAGPLYPGNIPVQQGPNYGTGESLKKHAYGFPVQSLSEPGGDLSALEEMWPPVTVEHYSTDKTLPLDSQMTADEMFSEEVVWDKLPRKSVPRRFSNSSSTSPSSPNLKLKRRWPMSVSRCPSKIVPEPGRHSSLYHHYSFNPSTSSQSIIPSVAGPLYPGNIPVQQGPNYGTGESLKKHAYGFPVQSLSEPGGDLSALDEMRPPVTVEHYPTDKTLPLDSQMTADEKFSRRVYFDAPSESVFLIHRPTYKRKLRTSRNSPEIVSVHGSPSSPNSSYLWGNSPSSQSNFPSVAGPLYPGNIPVQQGSTYGTGESLKKHAYGFQVQSLSEPGGDLSALEEMRPPVTVEHYPTDKTLPLDYHLQQPSFSLTEHFCWPSYTFTRPESSSDFMLNSPPCPQNRPTVIQDSTVCTEGSRAQDAFELLSLQSLSMPGGDSDVLVEVEAPVAAATCSVTNTLPTPSHHQTLSSDPGWSKRGFSCLTRSHSVPSLSQITSAKNKTFTRANSLPDLSANPEEFTPDITADENDESYRFQCSCPGLYQCSVTGLVFHMEGEGDVVYGIVPWNRKLLVQLHKRPAGPLFDIKCLQQSVCQLHLPHCEIRSTGGGDFLSVAHVNDEGIEFITPHKVTETHVIINITGFSCFGNVKDEDSPPDPVRALVLLFYRPPADPDLEYLLNVLLLPRNVVLRHVLRTRKKLHGDESYIETSSRCKLHPNQEYTLSTCPEDDSVLVQPAEAEFDCDNYDNYVPSFQVNWKTMMKHITLLMRDTNSSLSVWGRRVCLSSAGVQRSCGQSALDLRPNDRLLDIRSSFIDGISGPVLQSLLDKLLEKTVITDSERESADEMQSRGDKARFVIDTVRKKGEAASSEMIEAICELDPFLCDHLGLV